MKLNIDMGKREQKYKDQDSENHETEPGPADGERKYYQIPNLPQTSAVLGRSAEGRHS